RVAFRWLFPRVLAAVHHGGTGTTGDAIAAGIPSVVVPFFGAQRFWGSRIADLGLGPRPIPRQRLTVDGLAAAIAAATDPAGRAPPRSAREVPPRTAWRPQSPYSGATLTESHPK